MRVTNTITIEDSEIDIRALRSQGPGGQNVNKVATAIQLRFDIRASSLPDICKKRLLALHDKRITKDGVIVIKAQQYRSQDKNRQDALDRLKAIVQGVMKTRKVRRATRPTSSSKENRLEGKARRSRIKRLRKKVDEE
ncbi:MULTISPECIES: alternative ribosome rescue aminoacyl-tRNA hydrolase ArfB [Prosthecochloris]|uniref:Class I peptide chain release factor n=1 Tax=Prosthecochloris marina TaxID=2017681 RepID=A0A317T7V9_9CHLB|nr:MULTISPECIES: alternative ribosome rescue aminoacyl-tRNA hydrolase ArfB [Prosthecochloris]PWW82742.1 class I peptide chain release factor [Prosthecochloris marina]UZJ37969.1 alternative ribosome rescue aminoacyl-tRNA hydrolase ArfB [Prosthecochloris sp. SCSIO W1103]